MDDFLTTTEAAKYAGVSRVTILAWIKKGYLGDTHKQLVTTGVGCGYKIRQSDLNKYIHGWQIEEPQPMAAEPIKIASVEQIPNHMKNVESLKLAAANLRITIEFAQEELKKIEDLL